MARSLKRKPIAGITSAKSEKADKLAAHRRERRKVRERLAEGDADRPLPHRREEGNVWAFAKDGKRFMRSARKADLRK